MGKVSEKLNRAIEGFLQFAPGMSNHLEDKNNPHDTTKAQVGLGNVDNEKQATKAEFELHRGAFDHPDGSVAESKIAPNSVTTTKIGSQAVNTGHIVNKAVTGGKVADNTITAGNLAGGSAIDAVIGSRTVNDPSTQSGTTSGVITTLFNTFTSAIRTHFAGSANKHRAADVVYSGEYSVYDKINELVLTEGSGTFDHSELSNRTAQNQHSIGAITGLDNALGIIFEGTTTNETETEIFADPEIFSSVETDGRFSIGSGKGAVAELSVIALHRGGSAGNYIVSEAQSWSVKGFLFHYSGASLFIVGDTTHTKVEDGSAGWNASIAHYAAGNPRTKLMVTGEAGKTILWKAALKISALVDLNE